MHTPHHRLALPGVRQPAGRLTVSDTESDITLLTIGQHLTSLVAGRLHPQLDYDHLMVGSQTNLLAYDIEKNTELFYKEVNPTCYCTNQQSLCTMTPELNLHI